MDDLDHSVYIAEQDWDSFYQESEECSLQQGALAGLDESGLSDFDEAEFCLSNQEVQAIQGFSPLGSHCCDDSLSDLEGLSVDPCKSVKGLHGSEDAVSICTGDNEDPAELNCAEQGSESLRKDTSLDEPQETTEPAGAAHGVKIYQETARDCEDATGNTSREPEIQTSTTAAINLSSESASHGEIDLHASNCADVKSALWSLRSSNEHGLYCTSSEGEAYTVLKESQVELNVEIEESSLTRPAVSFADPQKESQMNTETQADCNIPVRAEHLSDLEKPPRKEKERWFVTVDVGQMHSREKTRPPVKKKRKKKSCSEDGPELGYWCEGHGPDIQSNSGAERLGVSEPESHKVDNSPDECTLAAEGSWSNESTNPTMSTTMRHHKLKNDQDVLVLSKEPLPVFQNTYEPEEHKVNHHKSQHVDNHHKQQKDSIRNNLQMNVSLEGKFTLKQPNYDRPESSHLVCSEVSDRTKPSNPTSVITPNRPNHQNLLVKLLFSAQTDTGCEMLVFCKDSDQEHCLFSQEERTSQEDAEVKNQCKHCVQHSQANGTSQKCPEQGIFSSETSISIKYPEFSSGCVLDTIPGPHPLHKCLSADQQVDLESKKFISEVPQITGEPTLNGLLLSETNIASSVLHQSKDFVTPDKLQDVQKIETDHSCSDQHRVKKSNHDVIHSEETNMVCLYSAERCDPPANYAISERDSILSASVDTQPLTVTKVNSCSLTADQHSIEKISYFKPATLHFVDTTVSSEQSVDRSPNENSVMTPRNSISHDPERNKDNLTGDGLCLRCPNMSKADSADNLSSQMFPEFLSKDPGELEVQVLDREETFAGDISTAGLSPVESPESNSKTPMEAEPVLPKEPVICTGDLESKEQDPTLDSTHLVYAISSFWDEMEKLTIKDILHLRLVGNALPPREVPHLQDTAVADVSDAADSGYFAHPDDSKPDCWTGDASLFSDFEDELQQTLSASTNPSPEPQDAKSQLMWSPEPLGVWQESQQDPACMGSGNDAAERMLLPTEDTISPQLSLDGTQSFKTMCKTTTVQNLQTLEEEAQFSIPLPVAVRAEGERNMLLSRQQSLEETCSFDLMEHENYVNISPLPLLSGKATPENFVMTCPEISKHLFGENEAETSLSGRASPIFYSPPETSLSGSASPIFYSPPETSLSGSTSPIVISLPETSLSDRASPTVYSPSETSLSGRTSPIVSPLSGISLSGRASPIVIALPETGLLDRASPIVCSPPEISLSGSACPIVISLPETSLSGRVSPIVVSLPETSRTDRATPIVYSPPETSLSGRASPIVVSLPETSLAGRVSPIVYSLCEMSLSDRASPNVVSLPQTNLSGRGSPIVYSLSETSLSGKASPIICSLSEVSVSGNANPVVYSPPEASLLGRASPIVCSLSEISLSGRSSPMSLCDRAPNELSLPETYDNFFSDYDAENVFFPPIWSLGNDQDAGVPIFSCSRSVKRECRFTEEYDFVFPEESPVEPEDEDRHTPIHVVTRFNNQAHEPLDDLVGPDAYEHFFTDKDWRGNLFWRNLLSLRRLRFSGGLYSSRDRSTSWAFALTGWRERSSLFSTPDSGHAMDNRDTSYSRPNLYLENQLCNEVWGQRDLDMQAVVSVPKKSFLFTLKQSDICLVCIAFASWVLKSANPQSQDMWKTALLANVSAISAIQYLRRYIRDDASKNKR